MPGESSRPVPTVRRGGGAADEASAVGGPAEGEFTRGRTDLRMLIYMGALGEALCGYLIVGRPELSPALADALVDAVTAGWRTSAEAGR